MRTATAMIAPIALVLAACGGGRDVDDLLGAKCRTDSDCEERCLGPNDDFPDGMCSYQCDSDRDCPSDAWCAETNGGVCLYDCAGDADCDFLGRDWVCDDLDRHGGGGKVPVCIGR